MIGQVFGRLTVIAPDKRRWRVRCECGVEKTVFAYRLRSGNDTSCGCGRGGRKYEKTTLRAAYNLHKGAGIRRGFGFLEESIWLSIVKQNCHYCGQQDLRNRARSQKHYAYKNASILDKYDVYMCGVDRIDSSKAYSLENTVPCCSSCNSMKNDTPYETFKAQIQRIYKKWVCGEN